MEQKKNSCTAVRKKNKLLPSYFLFQRALQNPRETATILPLLPFKLWICRIIAPYKQSITCTINISRNLSIVFRQPVVKKVGLPIFFPVSFRWPERESVPRKWPVFTAKSIRNTITLVLFSTLRYSIQRWTEKRLRKLLELFFI